MTMTTIVVTDRARAAALHIAMHNKSVVDVIDSEGDTVRGRVLKLYDIAEGKGRWIAVVEVDD